MKHARVTIRILSAVLVIAGIAGVGAATAGTPVDQPLPGFASITNPVRELTAGLTSIVTVKVQSAGPLPINWLAIAPANSSTLLSAAGQSGWNAKSLIGNRAVFADRQIFPGGSWEFNLELSGISTSGAVPAGDLNVPLTVETSHDGGAHKRLFGPPPNDPDALKLVVRVLRVLDGPAITAPARATDGTVTASQDNLAVGTTIRNYGSGTLNAVAKLTPTNAAIATASVPVTLAPGESKTLSYDVVAGKPADQLNSTGGTMSFALAVTSAAPAAKAAATSATSIVQAAPAISCKTVTAGGDDSIFNPAYSVIYDKTGLQSIDVSAYTLSIKTAPPFGPAPFSDGTIGAGDLAAQKLDFAPVAVPAGTPENSYDVSLTIAAVDSNGAVLADAVNTCPAVRVDIVDPRITEADMTEIDSALRPVKLSPDAQIAVTFSEVIASGVDSAEDWIPLDAAGNRVSGVTVQGVEPCGSEATDCRTLTVDAGFTDAWKDIVRLRYCRDDEATSYADLVGNHAACGSEVAVA